MQTKKHNVTKTLIACAVLAAIGFILDRYLGIMVPLFGMKTLSINASYVPIFFAGFLYGPLWGALVGAVQDLLGAFLVPQGAYFWGYTLTTALAGASAGVFGRIFLKKELYGQEIQKTGNRGGNIMKTLCGVSMAVPAFFLIFPMMHLKFADKTYDLTLGAAAIGTPDSKAAFVSLLSLFDGSAAEMGYTAARLNSVTVWLCLGVVASAVFGIAGIVKIFTGKNSGAAVFSLLAALSAGITAATQLIYVPKALTGLDVSVSFGIWPYAAPILFAFALALALALADGLKFKLAAFCALTAAVSSALNSLWLTMTLNPAKAYTVYLTPRLASALFLSAPVYTVLCWILIKRVAPRLSLKQDR